MTRTRELRSTRRFRRPVRAYGRIVPGPVTEEREARGRLRSIMRIIADKWHVDDIRWFTDRFMAAMEACTEAREDRGIKA